MTDRAQATANALDAMTASIMQRKQDKGAQLTPVGMERTIPLTTAPFPNDDPQEVVQHVVREIRRQAQHLLDAAAALEAAVGGGSGVRVGAAEEARQEQQAAEKAADEKFADRFARLKQDAMSATYGDVADSTVEGGEDPEPRGWTCPEHGTQNLVGLTSRRGRTYSACKVAGCREFEK